MIENHILSFLYYLPLIASLWPPLAVNQFETMIVLQKNMFKVLRPYNAIIFKAVDTIYNYKYQREYFKLLLIH